MIEKHKKQKAIPVQVITKSSMHKASTPRKVNTKTPIKSAKVAAKPISSGKAK